MPRLVTGGVYPETPSGDGAQDPIAPNSSLHLDFVLALVWPYVMSRSTSTVLQLTATHYVRVARLAHYLTLRSEIIRRGDILDNAAAQADFLVRGLAQKAGYRCVDDPAKVRFAEALRRLARQHLRNPTPWEQGR